MASSHRAARDFLRAPSVRASVERGDPLVIYNDGLRRGSDRYVKAVELARATGAFNRALDRALGAATAHPPEPDPPQPVTANPQTLDTQPDGLYRDDVHPAHPVDSDSAACTPLVSGEAHRAGWSEQDRLAFLARVQRIDPRERRP